MMDIQTAFQQLGIALGLGLLVGLQRERSASRLAGVRTFPLITLLGATAAMLAERFGGWIIAAALVGLAALIVMGNLADVEHQPPDPGLTTEIAMLLMYAVGAYVVVGSRLIAIAVGGAIAVLLQFKVQLHGFVARLGDDDLKAIMQFVLLSLVILPVLPDQAYGPYSVLNPRQIWWMVVLIVGIGLGGYIAYKFFGGAVGVALGGLLGGLVSSTATTVTYSRRAAAAPESTRAAAIVIMIASTVVFARVLVEIAVVAPRFLVDASLPLGALFVTACLVSGATWFWRRQEQIDLPAQENPSELKPALLFALVYALVLFAVAAVTDRFGSRGLYLVAALGGLTDVDAITLSTSQLVNIGRIDSGQAWRVIVVGVISNMLFKAAMIAVIGHRRLLRSIAAYYGITVAIGLLLVLLLN